MKKIIRNVEINYEFSDIGSKMTMVLLHGWGQNIEMMKPISDKYCEKFNTLLVDLPGFGQSQEPSYSWSVDEYVEAIHELIEYLKLKNVILIGHSFGGKISLLYASKYPCDKLIGLASPYCPEMKKLPLKNRIYKKMKKIPVLKIFAKIMQKRVGSTDYKNASETMRGVLVQSVNYNMSEQVKNITCPTLLIWGDLDTAVPYKRAYELQNLIKDAGVVLFPGATHYAYLERIREVILVLDNFLGVKR